MSEPAATPAKSIPPDLLLAACAVAMILNLALVNPRRSRNVALHDGLRREATNRELRGELIPAREKEKIVSDLARLRAVSKWYCLGSGVLSAAGVVAGAAGFAIELKGRVSQYWHRLPVWLLAFGGTTLAVNAIVLANAAGWFLLPGVE
jgi:hypothetical protein